MLLTKKTSLGGAYARKKAYEYDGKQFEADLKDGDIIKILSGGDEVTGEYGLQFVIKIETRNGEKNLALNQTTINNLIDAFGSESKDYVGKEVKVWIVKSMAFGKLQNVVYLSDPSSVMDEEGAFVSKRVEGVETGAKSEDEIAF